MVCICGERVVFLDPDVKVKTCPNCGISVYQEGVPTIALEGRVRRRGLTLTRQSKITVLLTVGAAVLLAGTLGTIAGRRYEMGRAAALAGEAEGFVAVLIYGFWQWQCGGVEGGGCNIVDGYFQNNLIIAKADKVLFFVDLAEFAGKEPAVIGAYKERD
jgi:hypothetical protein